jgi:hypothetical protein
MSSLQNVSFVKTKCHAAMMNFTYILKRKKKKKEQEAIIFFKIKN